MSQDDNGGKKVENWFLFSAEKMLKNGWPIMILAHRDKTPWQDYKWSQKTVTLKTVQNFREKKHRGGVGIICGNIIGLDDDHELGGAVTEEFIGHLDQLKDQFFPEYLARKGRGVRKPLRVFRLADGEVFKSCNVGKLQIIAKGRYFAAYGVHPVTGRPYSWTDDGFGSPMNTSINDIPEYSRETLEKFIAAVDVLEDAYGLAPNAVGEVLERIKRGEIERPLEALQVPRDLVVKACKYIKNNDDNAGWEEWNRNIMMPLYAASGGEDWGLELAHEVSCRHHLYNKENTDQRWEELSKAPPTRIGGGTLLWQARKDGMPMIGPKDWDHYRAFKDRLEILNTRTNMWELPTMFDSVFSKMAEKGSTPFKTFTVSRPEQVFDTVTWDPSRPFGHYEHGNARLWNLCQMPQDYGEPGDIEPWMDMMNNVYGQHTDVVVKRMAFDVQFPHLKPMWHELIIGKHGCGKNLNKYPLRMWFDEMARTINAGELEGAFNYFVNGIKHLEITEMASIDYRVFNKHKELFATQDPWIMVNEKHRKQYRVRNVVSCWMSSNEIDAMTLSPDERRVYVVRKTTPAMSSRALTDVLKWMERNWRCVIWHLRTEVEVDESFGYDIPSRTSDMADLVDMAGRVHDKARRAVEQAINGSSTLFSLKDLHDHLLTSGVEERNGVPIHFGTVRRAVMAMGARRCNMQGAGVVRVVSEDGSTTKKRLWTIDPDLVDAKETTIRSIYELFSGFNDIDVE